MPNIKRLEQHKLLLDTHVWIWLMIGETSLSMDFRKGVKAAQDYDGLLISVISVWELGMLVEKDRLHLAMDCQDWVDQALSLPGVQLTQLSPRIAVQSTRLPGEVHGDPADRILVATAHEENAVLITCDQKLLDYGKDRFISVYDPVKHTKKRG